MRGRTQRDGSTDRSARHDWWGVALEAPDGPALAHFYADLLGWEITKEYGDGASILGPDGVAFIAFQTATDWVRPVWPATPGTQHITMHLDLEVDDLAAAVENAVELGAVESDFQPQDDVRVLLDPAGHPFCLYVEGDDG